MQNQDDIELVVEASDDSTKITITVQSKMAISISDLALTLEAYLSDLTRAEVDRKKPGVLNH